MASHWLKLDYTTCEAYFPQPPSQGRPGRLLYPGENRTQAHQTLSRYSMELCCWDDWVCIVSASPSRQTRRNGSAQYSCEDPPPQSKDFGKGVGYVVSDNQGAFGTHSGAFVFNLWYWYEFFQPFLEATLRLSQKKRPLLYQVIPVIDILTERLEDISRNSQYYSTIRAGAAKGLAILNKYYSKTDESIMYRCTMSTFWIHYECNHWSPLTSAPSKIQTIILSVEEMAASVGWHSPRSLAWTLVDKLQAFRFWWTCNTVINEFGKVWVILHISNH